MFLTKINNLGDQGKAIEYKQKLFNMVEDNIDQIHLEWKKKN